MQITNLYNCINDLKKYMSYSQIIEWLRNNYVILDDYEIMRIFNDSKITLSDQEKSDLLYLEIKSIGFLIILDDVLSNLETEYSKYFFSYTSICKYKDKFLDNVDKILPTIGKHISIDVIPSKSKDRKISSINFDDLSTNDYIINELPGNYFTIKSTCPIQDIDLMREFLRTYLKKNNYSEFIGDDSDRIIYVHKSVRSQFILDDLHWRYSYQGYGNQFYKELNNSELFELCNKLSDDLKRNFGITAQDIKDNKYSGKCYDVDIIDLLIEKFPNEIVDIYNDDYTNGYYQEQ